MANYTEREKKQALALAFGVMNRGSMISGIPGGVPGLSRALSCGSCVIKLSRGIPTQFADHMTDEQKKAFKKALKDIKK